MKQYAVKMCVVTAVAALLVAFGGGVLASTPSPAAQEEMESVVSLRQHFDSLPATLVTQHFVVLHDVDPSWADHAGSVLEYAYECFFQELTAVGLDLKAPSERLVWLCFAKRETFDRYVAAADRMNLSHLDAYYSARTNRIALCLGNSTAPSQSPKGDSPTVLAAASTVAGSIMGKSDGDRRLAHEAAHQLSFNTGLLRRGVMYPLWVSEGFSTHFEAAVDQGYGANPHGRRLMEARAAGETPTLAQFTIQTRASSTDAAKDYAQAWGMFSFLLAQKPVELKAYLEQLSALAPGPRDQVQISKEFAAVFGSVERIELSWQAFLKALPAGTAPMFPEHLASQATGGR